MRFIKRVMTVTSATVALTAMATGPAFAHFCYQANRSAQGNAGAAGSQAFVPLRDVLTHEAELCDAGAVWWLAYWGLTGDETINAKTVMASGWFDREAEGPKTKHVDKLTDGRGIDHIPFHDPAFFPVYLEALSMCGD